MLAIDTSGGACSIALLEQDRVLAERHEDIGRGHAEAIMPWIAALPDGGKADSLLVGCGPGSFTGVRVGIAVARALALAWDVPVHGFSSLALIASNAAVNGKLLIAIEGGHGELFLQMFDGGAPVKEASALCSLVPKDAATRFDADFVAGNGASRFIEAGGRGQIVIAAARASLVLTLPLNLRTRLTTPVYGRGADAKPMMP